MYVFLIAIPIINYLNAKYHIFPTNEVHVLFIVMATIATAIITAYLAIKHFVNISKRKTNNGRC
jgi:undecaprenyl pyrophosphate phosphatase UppP